MKWYDLALSASVVAGFAVALTWPGPTPATDETPLPTPQPRPEVFAPDLTILLPNLAPSTPTAPGTPNRTAPATPPESGSPAPTRTTRPPVPTTIAPPTATQNPAVAPPPQSVEPDDGLIDLEILIELGLL